VIGKDSIGESVAVRSSVDNKVTFELGIHTGFGMKVERLSIFSNQGWKILKINLEVSLWGRSGLIQNWRKSTVERRSPLERVEYY